MHKIRSYISLLMLALLLFPMAEKAMHEIGHLDEDHCAITETHFCPVEHECSICDYLFSSSAAINPNEQEQYHSFLQVTEIINGNFISNTYTSLKYSLPLRGPPTT